MTKNTTRKHRPVGGDRILVGFRLDRTVVTALDVVAAKLRKPKSECVETAVVEYLEQHAPRT